MSIGFASRSAAPANRHRPADQGRAGPGGVVGRSAERARGAERQSLVRGSARASGGSSGSVRPRRALSLRRSKVRRRRRAGGVGGGRMGEALVAGLSAPGWARPGEVVVVEKVDEPPGRAGRRGQPPGTPASPWPTCAVAGRRRGRRRQAGRCRPRPARRWWPRRRPGGCCPSPPGCRWPDSRGGWPPAWRWSGPCPTRRRWSAPGRQPSPRGRRPTEADLGWAEEILGAVGHGGACPRDLCSTR